MAWTWFNDTKPKARKKYGCDLCGRKIQIGEKHIARRGADNGEAFTNRMHLDCEDVTRKNSWDESDWECCDINEFLKELDAYRIEQYFKGVKNDSHA